MEDKLLKREEVPVELTWKLEDVFATVDDWQRELEKVEELTKKLEKDAGSCLEDATKFYEILCLYEEVSQRAGLIGGYAHKLKDVDMGATLGQTVSSKSQRFKVEFMEKAAFLSPMLIQLEEGKLLSFYNEKPELLRFKIFIDEERRGKEHSLSPEMETLLASAGSLSMLPYDAYSTFMNADLKFLEAEDGEGRKHQITNGRYVPLMEKSDRVLRKNVFTKFYETFASYKNTVASIYAGQVNQLMFFAKSRKYETVLKAALDENNVSPKVYENLIEAIHENMDKLHHYVRLRKEMLGLGELNMYDLYVPIVNDVEMKFTIEEAKELVLAAIKPLGEEYSRVVKKAFDERWIDVMENEGKRSGAYASGMYGAHPYVLLNFNGTLSNVFTLAHEMGHAMHSYFSNKTQSYLDSDYTIFVAEVASTTNEVLLMNYLLEYFKDVKEKAMILNHYLDSFRTTVYRQTMFAEFEKRATELAESGVPIQANNMTELYYKLNKEYFGSDIEVDELIGYEWLRIPHFYYNFYVYQYATGFSAAVSIATRILEEGEKAVKPYLEFLKSGCTKDPVSLLKIAGVDMSTKQPIEAALAVFDKVIKEMEEWKRKGLI